MRQSKEETLNFKFEKSRKPRRIQICVLKNRDGETGYFVNFENYPAVNLYKEVSEKRPERSFEDVPPHWKADAPAFKMLKLPKTASGGNEEPGNADNQATDPNGTHQAPPKKHKKATERPITAQI